MYLILLKVFSIPIDNTDAGELKVFLEANFSPVFHIFYEAFITFEGNLKQKGKYKIYLIIFKLLLIRLSRALCHTQI